MGSNFNSQTVNVEGPDLLQVMAAKGVPINGCQWCRRTIFFNGAFWNHADGESICKEMEHQLSEDSFVERVQERDAWSHKWPHIFGKHYTVKVTVRDWKCKGCGQTSSIRGGIYGWCKARVATPAVRAEAGAGVAYMVRPQEGRDIVGEVSMSAGNAGSGGSPPGGA